MIGLALTIAVLAIGLRVLRPRLADRREAALLASRRTGGLPGVVVLLQIATASGRSPREAVHAVRSTVGLTGPVGVAAQQLAVLDDRLQLGADFGDAMLSLERDGEVDNAAARVLDVLRRGERDGAPTHLHLEVLLLELRRHRSTHLDATAQKLTVSMLFPLVFCILPAFVLLAVVPLLLSALAGLPSG